MLALLWSTRRLVADSGGIPHAAVALKTHPGHAGVLSVGLGLLAALCKDVANVPDVLTNDAVGIASSALADVATTGSQVAEGACRLLAVLCKENRGYAAVTVDRLIFQV